MEYVASIISLMFFLTFCIYLFLGINIFRVNPKEDIYKAFLSLSISLAIWSFGYAMINSAVDLETALLWKRISSLGRMYLFSIVLHFIILLTHEKDKLNNEWALFLLHIPSVLLILNYSQHFNNIALIA